MKYQLTPFPTKTYSLMELHLFDSLIKAGRPMTSNDLADAYRDRVKWKVGNPLNSITVTMNRLIDKVALNKEEFVIDKDDKRPGHPEVEFSIKPRKRNGRAA